MRVVVLGCGYVGRELGRQLRGADHDVVGVVRSAESARAVADAGLDVVRADVTNAETLPAVPDADALVFAASAGRGVDAAREVYLDGLRTVVDHFGSREDPPARLVYTSSTAVYGDHGGDWVDEGTSPDPETPREEVLAEAERVAADATVVDGTVARFAGLYGPDRYRLSTYLEGPVTDGVRNSIHRDDAAGAVAHLLTADVARGEVVNVADGAPVDRWEFADWLAEELGADPPSKQTVAERLGADPSPSTARRVRASKRVCNERLLSLGYELRYPSVREGYRPAIEASREAE